LYLTFGEKMNLPNDVVVFLDTVGSKYGKIKVMPKNSSKLMQAIGWLFRVTKISPEFMERYITTIGETVYFPDKMLEEGDSEKIVRVLVHETIHVADSKRFSGPVFSFLYLFPQSLALLSLLSLLAVWKIGFLWCLLFLLCLAPIPAPFRYWFELKAYRTQILISRKEDKLTDEQLIPIYEWIEKQLCTNLYYWTWPFPTTVRKHLKNEDWMKTGIYNDITKWILIRRITRIMDENKGKTSIVEHNQ
jgi:hypothetical protein